MMKKYIYLLFAITLFIASCTTNSTNKSKEQNLEGLPVVESETEVRLSPLDGYFSVNRPSEVSIFILDKSGFEKNFHPAATMGNRLREVDFSKERVGAIVLPETEYETEIILDKAYISNKIIHIIYNVNKGTEKRTFTILPVKLFTFDSSLNIDSVSFENEATKVVTSYTRE